MEHPVQSQSGNRGKTRAVLGVLSVILLGMGGLFLANLWGHVPARRNIPLVDVKFLETTPWRQTYADLLKAKEDMSDFDCYACHEKNKPPPIRFDANQMIIIPKEHKDLVMGHGSHDRNNLCYNCHNEKNLVRFQMRDGREVKFDDSIAALRQLPRSDLSATGKQAPTAARAATGIAATGDITTAALRELSRPARAAHSLPQTRAGRRTVARQISPAASSAKPTH